MTQIPPSINVTVGTPDGTLAKFNESANGAEIQTKLTMEITQDSIVAIGVASAEKAIRAHLGTLIRTQTSCRSALLRLITDRNTFLSKFSRDQASVDDRLPLLLRSLLAFLGKDPTITYGEASYNPRTGLVSGPMTIAAPGLAFSYTYDKTAPDTFLTLLTNIEAQGAEEAKLNTEIVNTRMALNNVDSLERQARAAVASEMVARTGASGQKLLDGINSTIDVTTLIENLRH